jgi:hypothetical protein
MLEESGQVINEGKNPELMTQEIANGMKDERNSFRGGPDQHGGELVFCLKQISM